MGWYGFDFDGTIATTVPDYLPGQVGQPIEPMIDKILELVYAGEEVRIFTARVAPNNPAIEIDRRAIQQFCRDNIGFVFPLTCCKDREMIALYDDRAIQVERDTGRIVG